MNKERYTRAFNRFLIDNPHVTIDEAQKEFNELYSEGNYKIDDDFDKAEDIYEEASNTDSLEDSIILLKEGIETCPYHYDSKILLTLLEYENPNDRILKLEDIREEYKKWLKERNIDLDSPNTSIWLIIEARPYIRLLTTITDECLRIGKYNEARKYSEMQYRLDYGNIVDSLFDYVLSVSLTGKNEYAISLSNDYKSSSRYNFLRFYNFILINNFEEAFNEYKNMYKTNPYFCTFISGIIDIDYEEVNNILNGETFNPDSFEEALYYITKCLPLIEFMSNKLDDYYNEFFDKQLNLLVNLSDDEIILLTRISSSKNGLSLEEIENIYNFDELKIDYSIIKQNLKKLYTKKYLEKLNDRYYMSRLTYFILKSAQNKKD